MNEGRLSIVLVEDDDVDVTSVERALRKAEFDITLHVARDGEEGLKLLRGDGDRPAIAMPYVILLDVNMPRMDGHTFLDELRNDPELRNRVVFMLTTSDSELDRRKAYDRNVAGYFLKGHEGITYPTLLAVLDAYRTGIAFPV